MKHKYSDEDFLNAVKTSLSISEVLNKLGLAPHGGSYKIFNLRVKELKIDTSHFLGQGHLKGKTHNWKPAKPLENILVKDSSYLSSHTLKKRLVKEGLLDYKCNECGIIEWNNKKLSLHLDHINGDNTDNRIENLRILCPNCHSQTDTYCSKNNIINSPKIRKSECEKILKEDKLCENCLCILKDIRYTVCKDCYNKNRKSFQNYKTPYKIIWPPIEELKEKLLTTSYVALSKVLGVSDNAIRKHIKNNS